VLAFCREQVGQPAERDVRQRVRYWGAIAVLRCVLSSPAAARAVLEHKAERLEQAGGLDDDPEAIDTRKRPFVSDVLDEAGGTDVASVSAVEEARAILSESTRRRLRRFAEQAQRPAHPQCDAKLAVPERELRRLLEQGFSPVLFCRYIPTAGYVDDHLRRAFPDVAVEVVTGELPEERRREPNRYFRELYAAKPRWLAELRAAEHKGQVDSQRRREREEEFREGRLSLLCCSPTMELGIDIRTLVAVHMRNVPPDPARHAQRDGRAGRAGQPALVLAFASEGNLHDRHFFEHRNEMIAGDVRAPVFDPAKRDVLQAHLQSL